MRNYKKTYFCRIPIPISNQAEYSLIGSITYEPCRLKTGPRGFRPGPTQTVLYSHRRWLESENLGFRKKRGFTICVAKTKALNSCVVAAQLICIFVFACAKSRYSHDVDHMSRLTVLKSDCS